MPLTWNPSTLYNRVATMRQARPAFRLIECLLDDDDGAFTSWDLVRPDGTAVQLSVAAGMPKQLVATIAGGEPTVLASAGWDTARVVLALQVHEQALNVGPGPDGADEAREAIADAVALLGLLTGRTVAAQMRVADGDTSQRLLWHAFWAWRLMDEMKALSEPGQRAEAAAEIFAASARHHALCEEVCNKGDPMERLDAQLKSLEQQIAARLQGAGIQMDAVDFSRDPRGTTASVRGSIGGIYLVRPPLDAVAVAAPADKPARKRQAKPAPEQAAAPVAESVASLQERAVTPEVLEVLRASRLEDGRLYLPSQLSRKLYETVDEAIRIAGGKWVGGKTRAHVFADGATQHKFARLLATGKILDPKDYDFYATPEHAAREIVELAGIEPGMLVAEPSAGRGAIASELAKIVGAENVHAFELLPEHAQVLRGMGFQVHQGDFLEQPARPIFDVICMNPPFGGQADMKHVAHALRMLKPNGRLVAIVSPAFEHRTTAVANSFRELMDAAGERVRDLPAGTFRESGTDVRTVVLRFEADRLPWNAVALADAEAEAEGTVQERMRA